MELSPKHKKFADEYLIDLNCTRAYSVAYNHKNKHTASTHGDRLLNRRDVKAYIEKQLNEIHNEKIANVNEIMKYLTAVMRREKPEYVVVKVREEKTIFEPDENGKMRRVVVKKENTQTVEIPTKISDSNKAADLLGKRYGIFNGKNDNENKNNESVIIVEGTLEN